MNFTNDDFIRTTEQRHERACQALWQQLLERDEIYLGSYAGWYAVRDEAFYAESELVDGPDGTKRAPSGAPVEWVEEPSYFFRLSAWQERLLRFYDDNPAFIAPRTRRNEVVSFVKGGLQDLSVSRTTFNWGVPGARRSGPCHVRLAGRVDQLHHRHRLSRHRVPRLHRRSGRPTCTWWARISCGFTRSTGRRS